MVKKLSMHSHLTYSGAVTYIGKIITLIIIGKYVFNIFKIIFFISLTVLI